MTQVNQLPLDVRYVEYGKIFLENGATDFQILDYSDEEILTLAGRNRCENFMDWGLEFPQQTLFSDAVGNISVALLDYRQGYLYVQVQSRREGELSRSLGGEPRIDRPFIQVRFTFLAREQIETFFRNRLGLYTGLLYQHPSGTGQLVQDPYALKDYRQTGQRAPFVLERSVFSAIGQNTGIDPAVQYVTNAMVAAYDKNTRARHTLLIQSPGLSWLQRLEIIQRAQYYLLPVMGVFSFALDHVTNQNVAVRLFEQAVPGLTQVRTHILGQGADAFPDNFYGSIARLSTEQLYHPSLAVYLGKPLRTRNAIEVYELIEESSGMDDQSRFTAIVKYHALLKQPPQDLNRVLDSMSVTQKASLMGFPGVQPELHLRLLLDLAQKGWPIRDRSILLSGIAQQFRSLAKDPAQLQVVLICLNAEELQKLIHQTGDEELRLELLQFAWNSQQGQIDRYAPFHLAVPPDRINEPIFGLLQAALRQGSSSAFDNISAASRPRLYQDLLKVRAIEMTHDSGTSSRQLINFKSTDETAVADSVVSYLLRANQAEATQALQSAIQANDVYVIGDIINELGRLGSLTLVDQAMKWFPLSEGVYTQVLGQIILPGMRVQVAQNPDVFRSLLILGRKLFGVKNISQTLTASAVLQNPDEEPLLKHYTGWRHLGDLIEAGLITTEKDAAFAEWWLYAELANESQSKIEAHYPAWRQAAQSSALAVTVSSMPGETIVISPAFLYLVLGGPPPKGMSLRRVCHEYQSEAANEDLYNAVVKIWLDTHTPFAPVDITYIISQSADDPEQLSLLARIVEDDAQAENVAEISAQMALRWILTTRGEKRRLFISAEGKDRLYQHLLALKRPDEAFIWEMLVIEDEAFNPSVSWGRHCNYCEHWQVHARSLMPGSDSRLLHYLNLALRLSDPFQSGQTPSQLYPFRRHLLQVLAEHRTGTLEIQSITLNHIYGLLEFYYQESDSEIRQVSKEVLARFVSSPFFSHQLPSFSSALTDTIRAFCEQNSLEEPLHAATEEIQLRARLQTGHATAPLRTSERAAPPDVVPQDQESIWVEPAAERQPAQGMGVSPNQPPFSLDIDSVGSPQAEGSGVYPAFGGSTIGGSAQYSPGSQKFRHDDTPVLLILLWVSLVVIGLSLLIGLALVLYIFWLGA